MNFVIRTLALSGALCLALSTAATLSAQDSSSNSSQQTSQQEGGFHHGPPSPEQELAHMTKALDLTSDQQTQLKPILQNRRDQLQQLRQDSSTPRPEKYAKMKAMDEESNSKVEAILNPEQKTKYESMIAKRRQQREESHEQHGAGQAQPQ